MTVRIETEENNRLLRQKVSPKSSLEFIFIKEKTNKKNILLLPSTIIKQKTNEFNSLKMSNFSNLS